MKYWNFSWKTLELSYWTQIDFIIYWIWIKWINQAEVPLEKYKDFLELSVKQLFTQSSPISLGQMCDALKKH